MQDKKRGPSQAFQLSSAQNFWDRFLGAKSELQYFGSTDSCCTPHEKIGTYLDVNVKNKRINQRHIIACPGNASFILRQQQFLLQITQKGRAIWSLHNSNKNSTKL
jgi:hypothetical protein